MLDTSRQAMQFWVSLTSMLGLVGITAACVIIDELDDGKVDQLTMLLAGGLLSVTAASMSWLFRSSNGHDAPMAPLPPKPPEKP